MLDVFLGEHETDVGLRTVSWKYPVSPLPSAGAQGTSGERAGAGDRVMGPAEDCLAPVLLCSDRALHSSGLQVGSAFPSLAVPALFSSHGSPSATFFGEGFQGSPLQ